MPEVAPMMTARLVFGESISVVVIVCKLFVCTYFVYECFSVWNIRILTVVKELAGKRHLFIQGPELLCKMGTECLV